MRAARDMAICATTWHSRGSELNGWAPIWQTNSEWASAAYLHHDSASSSLTLGFHADSMPQPTCAWQDLSTDFASLTREPSVLNLVASAEGYGVRAHISEELKTAQPNARRAIDSDLRGYHGNKPGWIADRICCLLAAAEIYAECWRIESRCRWLSEKFSRLIRQPSDFWSSVGRRISSLKIFVSVGAEYFAD
jgi:hypothetical protein